LGYHGDVCNFHLLRNDFEHRAFAASIICMLDHPEKARGKQRMGNRSRHLLLVDHDLLYSSPATGTRFCS